LTATVIAALADHITGTCQMLLQQLLWQLHEHKANAGASLFNTAEAS
jgi:hypothetical protein